MGCSEPATRDTTREGQSHKGKTKPKPDVPVTDGLKAQRHMDALVARVVGEYRVRRELLFQRRNKPMDTRGRRAFLAGVRHRVRM